MINAIAGLALTMCFTSATQLPFPIPFLGKQQKKQAQPPIPKSSPPRIFSDFNDKLERMFTPASVGPEWIEMYFQGPRHGYVRIVRPSADWEMQGPVRLISPDRPLWHANFVKGDAIIQMVVVLDGGADAYDLAEQETILIMSHGGAVIDRPARTLYQNLDGVLIHRADMRCAAIMEADETSLNTFARSCPRTPDRSVSFVLASFHEPRSALAYAPYSMFIRAEYPPKQKKEVMKALYLVTGFTRIAYETDN